MGTKEEQTASAVRVLISVVRMEHKIELTEHVLQTGWYSWQAAYPGILLRAGQASAEL